MKNTDENKKRLLGLPMNKLGITGGFNGWFCNKRMEQKDVVKLFEFISLNQHLKNQNEQFICWRNDDIKKKLRREGLTKRSASFKKLTKLLLENGFDHKDWILLLPEIKTSKGLVPNYALLDKKSLIELSLFKVTDIKESCMPATSLHIFISEVESTLYQPIQVKNILSLDGKKIDSLFKRGYGNQTLENTLISIQKKFREYGLSEEDGPFMSLNLPCTKSKEDYIEDLITNKGFTDSEASTAVYLGLKAGWIQI